jgi:hypothetical protein
MPCACIAIKAGDAQGQAETAQPWQTDFTDLKLIGHGWFDLPLDDFLAEFFSFLDEVGTLPVTADAASRLSANAAIGEGGPVVVSFAVVLSSAFDSPLTIRMTIEWHFLKEAMPSVELGLWARLVI